ncbi:MAG: winged helix-turn-helix domain-containing protein [Chloroflexi bacterium]|nr:winged helix-turn-helix domain-containing protein [Chloroflexota bacterium]
MRNAGRRSPYNELLRAVFGAITIRATSPSWWNISRLRQEDRERRAFPACIVTVAGGGYMMPSA